LNASPLRNYLRLGTDDSPDGTFGPEDSGTFWRADVPLRIALGHLTDDRANPVLHTADGKAASIAQVLQERVQPPPGGTGTRVVEICLRDGPSNEPIKSWPCVLDYTTDDDNLLGRIDAFVESVNAHLPVQPFFRKTGDQSRVEAHKKDWSVDLRTTLKLKLTVRQATWVRHATIDATLATGTYPRWITVLDDSTGASIPGSPLIFDLTGHNTPDKWPAFIRDQLNASPLRNYLRLGTDDSPDGTFGPEDSGTFWRADVPLRIALG
ncbi:hypothetical protein ACLPJF_27840, partial [Pseudomonas vlassakiae]|uniref:hypothetical protein n=1 Tax=Pseudomonas vlassakiae TaxID=485888 RepID=UPI003FD8C452